MVKLSDKKVKIPVNLNKETSGGKSVIIPNPEYLYLQTEYFELIKQVPNDNPKENEFIGGMPVQLEKGCLKQIIKQKSYVMTLKVDGERFLMFLASNGIIYFIDRSLNFFYFMDDSNTDRLIPLNLKPFLFDGELVMHKNHYEYLIFDCLFYQNESFIYKPYNIRYDVSNFALNNVFHGYIKQATKQFVISLKVWYSIYLIGTVSDVYKYIEKETNKTRTKENYLKADGIILQPFDTPYVPFGPWNKYNNVQFKWKPSDELTIDFKIKITGPNEWNLLTKSGEPYMINQEHGDPLPATCIPSETQKSKFYENEVVEFKFKPTGNPNGILFIPVRSRNEKDANSLGTIKSTMCVIKDPFSLDLLKPAIKFLESGNTEKITSDAKSYLNLFSTSDLIMCILPTFFTKLEKKKIKGVYDKYVEESAKGPVELEFRIFKQGKSGKDIDKFTFYYLEDYLKSMFAFEIIESIDIIENSTDSRKLRSTYKNLMKDIMEGNSITNEYKHKIKNYTLEPLYPKKKLYNNLTFKLELANEVPINKVIRLRSLFAGKTVNNLIRVKIRYAFTVNKLWKIDLTKVQSAYTLETLQDKNEKFECECEYIGGPEVSFETFINSMDNLFRLILTHSNYCDSCV